MSTIANSTCGRPIEESAFEQLPVPALVVNRQGEIVSFNRSARMLLNQDSDAVHSKRPLLSEVIGGESHRLVQDIIMGASVGFISLSINISNKKRYRFSVTPLKAQPRQVDQFLLTLAPDSAVSKNFIQLNKAIEAAKIAAAKERRLLQQLEQSYERVSEFSTMAAHDLKAPLRNIDGFLNILEEDHGHQLNEDGVEVLQLARKSAMRLQSLIISLLDHAKAKSSIVTLERVNLAEAVERIRDDLQVMIGKTNGRLELADSHFDIQADPLLFGQLLGNLIDNAFKYCSPDRAPDVRISCRRTSDAEQEISIEDNGLGFDNANCERILKPFERLHARSAVEGNGLGLATCKTICDLHGWTLLCEGSPGVGSTFTIRMKVAL